MARQGVFDCENKSLSLAKWGLIIFNVAFWCLGVVSLGIGIWVYVAMNEHAVLTDGKYLVGSVFLIAVGFGVIIVGFLGIVAAIWESRIMATFFGLMVLLAFAMYLTVGIWSFINLNQVNDITRTDLVRTMMVYERNQAYQDGWDSMQSSLMCCGVESYAEWNSAFPSPRIHPQSCCSEQSTCYNTPGSVYTEGCQENLVNYETQQLNMMGPIGLAFGCFQILGLLISVLFCIKVRVTKPLYYR